jgi:hypothetical protein
MSLDSLSPHVLCHPFISQDRVHGATFPLRQQVATEMLGVRRQQVSGVARALRAEGLITDSRGRLTIQDRTALEARACACYGIIRRYIGRVDLGRSSK